MVSRRQCRHTGIREGGDSLVFLFDAGKPVSDPGVRQAVETSLMPAANDARISTVLTTWSTGNPGMVSKDGTATYAVAMVKRGTELDNSGIQAITDEVTAATRQNGLQVQTGGGIAIGAAISGDVQKGIVRAETFSVPLTLVIQLIVFGGLVAAGVPLLIGVLSIIASIAIMFLLSTSVFQSVFAVNVITMLGLGLGIDYSLFMVTRFREEIAHRPVSDAIAVTMATVGKAILFSGITVIFGLAATQFFPLPALQSMGQAGIVVTAMALIYGLVLLPAILAMLGTRINALSLRRKRATPDQIEHDFWHRLASMVMRRPVMVLVPLLLVLLAAGTPLLNLNLTLGGPEQLPANSAPRIVTERLNAEFPGGDTEAIPVLLTFGGGDPMSSANVNALQTLDRDLRAIPGVIAVDSFLTPPAGEGGAFDWATYNGDPSTLPASLQATVQSTVRGDRILIAVHSNVLGSDLQQLARDIRALPTSDTAITKIEAGGSAGAAVDTLDGINSGLLPAVLFVLIGSYLILLLTFGSVFLPLKAIFMTLLSITASLGMVVLVFQEGNLEGLLGFQATGQIISTTPILIACILFGLSMDYEVLMLSRIQEEYQRTGNNRQSVAFGLAQTAKVITGAAAIMVVVFGGFMLADIAILKSMGFGLALAVLIDATIVRGLLVPATMRLMGRWNWWAPAPVKRIVDRLGFSHHTDLPTMPHAQVREPTTATGEEPSIRLDTALRTMPA
ncbi:MAG: MMPL family transporter [Thermomicrobiales bacterium]